MYLKLGEISKDVLLGEGDDTLRSPLKDPKSHIS